MTDLCDEPNAESNCDKYMQKALSVDVSNPEVYSTLASVRLSQCRNDEAKKYLESGMDLWYVEPEQDKAVVIDPSWPTFPARLALARLLIEVSSFERAVAVLETCQAEDDEDAEIMYLFGWCYYSMAELDPQESTLLLQDALECFEAVLQVFFN
jgi:tetratricopeptide (TPR) repeat protein